MTTSPIAGPRRGFTLIELLTVIAIIGILAAIIIPVVGKVRQTARASAALSGMRDLGMGTLVYTEGNRGYLPFARDLSNVHWHQAVTGAKPDLLNQAAMVDPVFNARSGAELKGGPNHAAGRPGVGINMRPFLADSVPDSTREYGLESYSNPLHRRVPLNKVTYPSRRIMLASSTDWHFTPNPSGADAWVPDASGVYPTGDPERHGNKAVYVMFDGSARMLGKEAAFLAYRDPKQPSPQ